MDDMGKNPLRVWTNETSKTIAEIMNTPYYGVPKTLSQCNLEDVRGVAKKVITGYLDNFKKHYDEGRGIIFFSNEFGTGKSGSAVSILEQCLYYYINPYFSDCGKLIEDCCNQNITHPDKSQHWTIQDYAKYGADVLIIDDLKVGGGKWGDVTTNIIEDILKTRANNLRPTIVTTNLTMNEIKQQFGGAVQEILLANTIPTKLDDQEWRRDMKTKNEDYFKKYTK